MSRLIVPLAPPSHSCLEAVTTDLVTSRGPSVSFEGSPRTTNLSFSPLSFRPRGGERGGGWAKGSRTPVYVEHVPV